MQNACLTPVNPTRQRMSQFLLNFTNRGRANLTPFNWPRLWSGQICLLDSTSLSVAKTLEKPLDFSPSKPKDGTEKWFFVIGFSLKIQQRDEPVAIELIWCCY